MSSEITIRQELSEDTLRIIKAMIKEVVTECLEQQFGEKLLSPDEACKIFCPSISTKTLSRYARDGKVPAYRMGGRLFYKYKEILASAKSYSRCSDEFRKNMSITQKIIRADRFDRATGQLSYDRELRQQAIFYLIKKSKGTLDAKDLSEDLIEQQMSTLKLKRISKNKKQ